MAIDKKISKVLKYVKTNPSCNSNKLDDLLVHDLVEEGYLSGWDITCQSTPADKTYEYQELRITLNGERYFEYITNNSQRITKSFWRLEKLWIPILLIFITGVVSYLVKYGELL